MESGNDPDKSAGNDEQSEYRRRLVTGSYEAVCIVVITGDGQRPVKVLNGNTQKYMNRATKWAKQRTQAKRILHIAKRLTFTEGLFPEDIDNANDKT